MSMKLGASSGSYNVQASELARNKSVTKSIRCFVRFLDESEAVFEIDVSINVRSILKLTDCFCEVGSPENCRQQMLAYCKTLHFSHKPYLK